MSAHAVIKKKKSLPASGQDARHDYDYLTITQFCAILFLTHAMLNQKLIPIY